MALFWLTMCINSSALWKNEKINEHFDLKHLNIVKTKTELLCVA